MDPTGEMTCGRIEGYTASNCGSSTNIGFSNDEGTAQQTRNGGANLVGGRGARRNSSGTGFGIGAIREARYRVVFAQVQILQPGHSSARSPGPASNQALRDITNTRNEIIQQFASTGSQPSRNGLTRAGRSFQKHTDRGEFVRTSNSQTTFNRQGAQLLNSIVNHPRLSVSVTQNSNLIIITAPGIGSAHFTPQGVFHNFSTRGQ